MKPNEELNNSTDLISRQAAIDVMCDACSDWCDEGVCKKVSAIQKLPSVQPNITENDWKLIRQMRSNYNGTYAKVIDKLIASAQPKQTASNYLQSLPTSPLLVGKMPSAQPEIIRCKDCMYYRPIEEASEPHGFCIYHCSVFRSDGFCSEAGRREDEIMG